MALTKALALAREQNARLSILHVLPSPVAPTAEVPVPVRMYAEMEAWLRNQAEKRMEKLLQLARKSRVRASAEITTGVPPEEIVRAARAGKAELIVMGTHGRTGISKLLLGSVASRVVSGAGCPVMTVRSGSRRARRLRA